MKIVKIRELLIKYINSPEADTSKHYILIQIEASIEGAESLSDAEQQELIKIKELFSLLKSGKKMLFSVQNGDNDNPISAMLALEYLKDALFGSGSNRLTNEQEPTFRKFMLQFIQLEICTSVVDIMVAAYGGVIDDNTFCYEERCWKDKTISYAKPGSEFPEGVEVKYKDIGEDSVKIRQYTIQTTDGSKIFTKLGALIPAKVLNANKEFDQRLLNFVEFYFQVVQKHIQQGVTDLPSLLQQATAEIKKNVRLDGYLAALVDHMKKMGLSQDELCAMAEDNVHNYLYQVNAYIDMGVPADCICIGKIFNDPVSHAMNARMSPLHTAMYGGMVSSRDTLRKLNGTFRAKLPEERRQMWRGLANSFADTIVPQEHPRKRMLNTLRRKSDDKLHKIIMYGGPITKTDHDSDYTLCVCGTTDEKLNIFGAPFNMVISPDRARYFFETGVAKKKIVLYTQLMKEHESFAPSKGSYAKLIYGVAEHSGILKAIARQEPYEAAKGPATSFNIAMNLVNIIMQYPRIVQQLIKPAFVDPVTGKIIINVSEAEANCYAPVREIWQLLNEKLIPEIRFIDAEGKDIPGKALELIVQDYSALRAALYAWELQLQQASELQASSKTQSLLM